MTQISDLFIACNAERAGLNYESLSENYELGTGIYFDGCNGKVRGKYGAEKCIVVLERILNSYT